MSQEKKTALELLKNYPWWQYLREELMKDINTLNEEITEYAYDRDNTIRFTLDDIKRAELSILKMLVDLPDTILEDLKWVIIIEDEK